MPSFRAALASLLGVASLFLAACATFPEIDAVPAATGTTRPMLVPLEPLLAAADAGAPSETTDLNDRASRLKARAALMRGPVHDPQTRTRLDEAARAGTP